MGQRFHSVTLLEDKCRGCTNCIKGCPTEAIRVRAGKARINADRCTDCGECIRRCDNHAKIAVTDPLERLSEFRYRIALPPPALYGQFEEGTDPERVLEAFLEIGFDEVYEVAFAADIMSIATREFVLHSGKGARPYISSACPAVVRLIQVRFPGLIDNLVPLDPPITAAAKLAKKEKAERLGLRPEEIGAFFITPCPAKATWIKESILSGKSFIDGAISVASIYPELLKALAAANGKAAANGNRKAAIAGATPVDGDCKAMGMGDGNRWREKEERRALAKRGGLQRASGFGIGWGTSGGENEAVGVDDYLVVDGIHNVIAVLEEVEMGKLDSIDFIEAQACIGGCVGGPLMVRNPFIGRVALRKLVARFKGRPLLPGEDREKFLRLYHEGFFDMQEEIIPLPAFKLDQDMAKAISKMEELEKVLQELPGLDCGSCGSPHCRALAEDIVQGLAVETDCVFKLREQVKILAEELFILAQKDPSAIGKREELKEEARGEPAPSEGTRDTNA